MWFDFPWWQLVSAILPQHFCFLLYAYFYKVEKSQQPWMKWWWFFTQRYILEHVWWSHSGSSILVVQEAPWKLSFNGRLFIQSGQQVVSPTATATRKPCSSWGAGSDQDEVTAKWQGRPKALSLRRKREAGSEDRRVVHCVQQPLTPGRWGRGTQGASECVRWPTLNLLTSPFAPCICGCLQQLWRQIICSSLLKPTSMEDHSLAALTFASMLRC